MVCFSHTWTSQGDSPSTEGSANIVKYFLDERKSFLQEEALDRAIKNKLICNNARSR